MLIFPTFFILSFSFAVFAWTYGVQILNPASVTWLAFDDSSPSFFGMNFFMSEPWHLPPGLLHSFNAPIGTSIVYSDSFPLFSVFLKFIHTAIAPLSLPIQVVGIWICVCFLAQGLFSFLILHRETKDRLFSMLGAMFFVLSPALLYRSIVSTRHFTLMGHFLVILAVGELIAWGRRREFRFPLWWALLVASLGIHFYVFAMVGIIYLVPMIEIWIEKTNERKKWLMCQITLALSCLLAAYVYGYTGVPVSETTGGGFGLFAMDSLSWLLSDGRSWFLPFSFLLGIGPMEGFQYLGFGVIIGIVVMFYRNRRNGLSLKKWASENKVLFLVLVFLLTLSFSRRFWFFGVRYSIFLTIPLWFYVYYLAIQKVYPMKRNHAFGAAFLILLFLNFVGTFLRSSGRMGWPLTYLILFTLILQIAFQVKKRKLVLSALLLIQMIDLYPLVQHVRSSSGLHAYRGGQVVVDHKLSDFVDSKTKQLIVISGEYFQDPELYYHALIQGIPIGPVYLARHDHPARARLVQEWLKKLNDHAMEKGDAVQIVRSEENQKIIDEIMSDSYFRFLDRGHSILAAPR